MLKSPVTPDGREKVPGQQAWLSPWSREKNTPRRGRCPFASSSLPLTAGAAALPSFLPGGLHGLSLTDSSHPPRGFWPHAPHSWAESVLFVSTVLARSFARPTWNIPRVSMVCFPTPHSGFTDSEPRILREREPG